MAEEKLQKVTFTENVDHYVKGDTEELSAEELKRVDDYAKRWNISKPYVKGEKSVTVDESDDALPSRTTTVTSADGSRRAATTSSRSNATTDAVVDKADTPETTNTPNGDNSGAGELGDQAGDAGNDEGAGDSGNDGDSSASAEGNQPASELPPATDKPVTGQGKTPRSATKKPANA